MIRYWLFFVITVIISVGAFLGLMAFSIARIPLPDIPEAVLLGKQVWQRQGCIECHTIFGDGGYNAPDLTHEASRRSAGWLEAYFQNPPVMRPSKSKRHPGLGSEDTDNMVKYLEFVSRIKIPNWPPKPLK